MIYFLLVCVVYLSFRAFLRQRKTLSEASGQPRNASSVDNAKLLSVQDGLRIQDEDIPEPEADIFGPSDGNNGGAISFLAFLGDGKRLASACKDDDNVVIQLWDVEDGREVKPSMFLGAGVNVMAVSEDGHWIVSGEVDGNMAIWNTTSRKKEGQSVGKHELKITALDVSPNSLCIASGSDDGTLMVWRIDSASEPALRLDLGPLSHQDSEGSPISSVKFSPAGGRIASGYSRSGYYTIQIWHSTTGDRLTSIPTDGQATRSLSWSSDGQRLVAGGPYGSMKCFDVASQRCLAKWEDSQFDVITSLYVSNTGQFLVSASASGRTVDLWDLRDISKCKHLHSYRHSDVLSVAISPSEHYFVSGGRNGKIYKRRLSDIIEPSCFFHGLNPLGRQSEPLMYVSNAVHAAWKNGRLDEAEEILSNEIAGQGYRAFVPYARANRSLVRARLRKWDGALEDAEATLSYDGPKLPIAYIANSIALCGQGKREEAMDAFNNVLDAECFVEHIKSIIFFAVELRDKLYSGTEPSAPSLDAKISPLVQVQNLVRLAEYLIREGVYVEALELLSKAPDLGPFLYLPETKTIFLLFGWNLYDLNFMVHQLKSQALAASGRTKEAIETLCMNGDNFDEEMDARNGIIGLLDEKFGDQAMRQRRYDDAIAWYTLALGHRAEPNGASGLVAWCLAMFDIVNEAVVREKDDATALYLDLLSSHSQRMVRLLLKRSKAGAEEKLWEGALNDANEAIRLDPLCPWGYERRRAATPTPVKDREGGKGGNDGSNDFLSMVEKQVEEDISQLRHNYVSHPEPEAVIDAAIRRIGNFCPLVLIDVKTGLLCDETERKRIFKADPIYSELVSSMTTQLDVNRIVRVVARFFRYVMFSHTWEGQEPTFQDVSRSPGRAVYNLDSSSPLNQKLSKFCQTVRDDHEGYRWAWSDTCCIDKTIEAVYKKSIRSMYNWYKWSSLTLVLLADVSQALSSSLKDNRWMSRAWTLQELLSPKAIRFYDHGWKLYRGDTTTNHKESPHIMRELAEAIYIAPDTLADFSPETLGVREKLRLASTRNVTVEEDIAYSLIGIFNSDLIPEPRDAAIALGLLLQEIVDRDQELTVLDWTGEPSKFHSCLPTRISVYGQTPYTVPRIAVDEMEKRSAELRNSLTLQQDAITFYGRLSRLDPSHFTNRRLHLPCIIFPITVTKCEANTRFETTIQGTVHLANAAALGEVPFKTTEMLPSNVKLILVYPWIRDLVTQAHLPEGNPDTRVSRLIAHLEQPFTALLLAKHPVHNEYRRIATDNKIIVPKRKMMSLKDVDVERLVML